MSREYLRSLVRRIIDEEHLKVVDVNALYRVYTKVHEMR